MKTRTAILLTVVMVALYAAGLAVATVIASSTDRVTPAEQMPTDLNPPCTAPETYVTPTETFDLEAASPAVLEGAGVETSQEAIEMPKPDHTWYDPQRMEEVAGIS